MAYRRLKTRTEEITRQIRREESLTRALRRARVPRRPDNPLISGSMIDGLIISAVTMTFYGIYHLLRGAFFGLRWGFRRLQGRRLSRIEHKPFDKLLD